MPDLPTRVVALAASLGGVEALTQILAGLPADFPAALVVVLHLSPDRESRLDEVLQRLTALPVQFAREGDVLRPAAVFLAPPDRHLVVNPDGTLSLYHSPPVHFARPSAEPLFESLAASFRAGAIAVVLTGRDSDGSRGVRWIKRMGGTVIAQDEASSQAFGMPEAAIATGCVDMVLPLGEVAAALVRLVRGGDQDRLDA